MTRICLVTMLLAFAEPALAHPGHGMPGWLHHGEAFAGAAMVIGGLLLWRRASGLASRRSDS